VTHARTRIEAVRAFLPTSPFVAHLGVELRTLEPDHAVLALPFRPEVVTIGDVVHGGALSTLVDTAAMVAAWANDDPVERLAGATVSLTVEFLAPVRASEVLADARVTRRGCSLCFCEVTASAGGAPVVKALATYRFA
jgi:uncharacterized protein (TIGR00369 family)